MINYKNYNVDKTLGGLKKMEKLLDKETRIKVQEILENMEDNVQLVLIKGNNDYSEILEQLLLELTELNDLIDVKVFFQQIPLITIRMK